MRENGVISKSKIVSNFVLYTVSLARIVGLIFLVTMIATS